MSRPTTPAEFVAAIAAIIAIAMERGLTDETPFRVLPKRLRTQVNSFAHHHLGTTAGKGADLWRVYVLADRALGLGIIDAHGIVDHLLSVINPLTPEETGEAEFGIAVLGADDFATVPVEATQAAYEGPTKRQIGAVFSLARASKVDLAKRACDGRLGAAKREAYTAWVAKEATREQVGVLIEDLKRLV